MLRKLCFLVFALVFCACSGEKDPNSKPKIAIIGGGASGLASAFLLEKDFDVTVFEKEDKLGGHADTVYLEGGVSVEAGFEFFSTAMFPRFIKLLGLLKVETHEFDLYYTFRNTSQANTIVVPPRDLSNIPADDLEPLLNFQTFLISGADLVKSGDKSLTLQKFVETLSLPQEFCDGFLYPFFASMWGVTPTEIKDFTASLVVSWLVLNVPAVGEAPKWFEVSSGTSGYIDALADQLGETEILLSAAVTEIKKCDSQYEVKTADGFEGKFDYLVFATNASVAKKLLKNLEEGKEAREQLSKIRYFKTYIAIHGDSSVMPPDQKDWGVVNIAFDGAQRSEISVHKAWRSTDKPVYKTWVTYEKNNDLKLPEPLLAPLKEYYHAAIDLNYVSAQVGLQSLQGKNNIWFAGTYTSGLDSHESAIVSAIEIAKKLAPNATRLQEILAP